MIYKYSNIYAIYKNKSGGGCLIKNYINQNIVEADTINYLMVFLIDHFVSVHHYKKCHNEWGWRSNLYGEGPGF
jgi:hypothetical protein